MIVIEFEELNDTKLFNLEDEVSNWLVGNLKAKNTIIFRLVESFHDEILQEMEERGIIEIP